MTFTTPEPVKELEDWFLGILRSQFPKEIFVLIGHEINEEFEPVPFDFVRIIYTGMSFRHYEKYNKNNYGFQIVYSSHIPSTMLPHRRALAMMEKGRDTLFELRPPGLLNVQPLQLQSERLGKSKKGCDCGPTYIQTWAVVNEVATEVIPPFDPCFGEPNSLLLAPIDYITPINNNYYTGINPNYSITDPITNGNTLYIYVNGNWILNPNYIPGSIPTNPPYWYDTTTGLWIPYPYHDPNFPATFGNLPFIALPFVKSITATVIDRKTETVLYKG